MPELDDRLRALGEASATVHRTPDADAWEAVRDRLDGDGTTIVTLSPVVLRREPRRNRFVAAAAVALAAVLVGAVLLVSRRDSGGSLAVATADGALPRVLLDPVPDGYRLGAAYDDLPTDLGGLYVILLRSTTTPTVDVRVQIMPGPGVSAEGAEVTQLTVQGHDAYLTSTNDSNSNLLWDDGVVSLQVLTTGAGTGDGAVARDIADRLVRNGPDAADVSLASVPTGFTVRYAGPMDQITASGGYQVEYAAGAGSAVVVRVGRVGMPVARWAALGGYRAVTVDGRPGFVGPGSPAGPAPVDDSSSTVLVDLGDAVVMVAADAVTPDRLLDIARHLRTLDDATWRSRLGTSLQSVGSPTASTAVPATPAVATTIQVVDPAFRLTEAYVARPDMDPASPCLCNWRMEPLPADAAIVAPVADRVGVDGVVAVKFGRFSGFGEANAPVTMSAWIVIREQTLTPSCPAAADAPTSAPACGPVEGWSVAVVADQTDHRPLVGEDHGGLPSPTLR